MSYWTHLMANWRVAFHSFIDMIFHFVHGLIPLKYTSHEYWENRK